MNGIGKTALARVVYEMIFRNFDACCFLSNVSEVSTRHHGLSHLQEKLIRHTLELDDLKIRSDQEGTILLLTRLRGLKILLVLDDVDHFQQLEKLAGKADWFGVGSRIIITTRDAHILKRYRLGKDEIYKAELLNDDEASQLFCRKAFKCDYPEEVYEGLTSRVLEYAKGLPFAIESLASSLLKQNVSEWSGVLTKLQKIPDHWTMKVLRKSFDGLPDLEKEIFLDIACFFVGKKIDEVKEILRNYKSDPEIGIKNLIEKSLVTILDQKIRMHDLHQKMGWEIVRQESPDEPGRRSRLWLPEDLRHVNEANVATVEAIALNQDDFEGFPLRTNVFSKMIRLKLLVIRNVRFSGSLNFLPESLIYVSWYKYPFPCLPSSFKSQSLVKLLLHGGNITQLWEGMKELPNLRMMSLIDSKCLIKTPDLRGLQNLERLDLKGCTALLHIDPSITVLPNLKFLNLRNCTSLMSIPNNLFGQKSIEILNLAGCTKLAGCLDFNPLRSSLEVKVLSNQYFSMFTKLLYCIIAFVLRRLINNDSLLKDVIEDGCAAS
ncbi:disease resistance protein Roq1-like [Prosopis cineraria]|uniref:disease resistance protein Roq1-like n=1 Tax=Prosopis cineraria TaxID=364024 RepID=UPI00240FF8EB|nr:disease resistance protein Roq1-like [Prosopis cineraria]